MLSEIDMKENWGDCISNFFSEMQNFYKDSSLKVVQSNLSLKPGCSYVCETQDVGFQRVEFIGFLEDSMVIILGTEILPNHCIYFFICIKVKVRLYDWADIRSIDSAHLHQLVQPYQNLPMQGFWLSLEGLSLFQHLEDFPAIVAE